MLTIKNNFNDKEAGELRRYLKELLRSARPTGNEPTFDHPKYGGIPGRLARKLTPDQAHNLQRLLGVCWDLTSYPTRDEVKWALVNT